MIAEGVRAALSAFPGIAPLAAATSIAQVEGLAERADAVALDVELPGAAAAAGRLRRRGLRVVWIGPVSDDDGDVVVSPEASVAALAHALVPDAPASVPTRLSGQQSRVLGLVAQGMTAQQVARSLAISPKTVEQHKRRIFEKLGVPNQAAAVRVALARGLEGVRA